MGEIWKSIKSFLHPDPKEVVRKWRREIRKQKNALNRDIRNLQLEQKKVEQSVREAAKRNDAKSMRVLAREVIRSRQAVVRMLENRGTLDALDLQMSESLRNHRLSKTLESSGNMVKEMNKLVRIERYQETVFAMQKEMYRAGMLSEQLHEGIDGLADVDDLEEETEEKVQEVLDEICGETLARGAAATVPMNMIKDRNQVVSNAESVDTQEVDELMRALAAGEI